MPKIDSRKATGQIVSRIVITHYDDGSLAVEGPTQDKMYVLAVLENAKDAIRNHRNPNNVDLIIPGHDVSIETPGGVIAK